VDSASGFGPTLSSEEFAAGRRSRGELIREDPEEENTSSLSRFLHSSSNQVSIQISTLFLMLLFPMHVSFPMLLLVRRKELVRMQTTPCLVLYILIKLIRFS